MDDHQNNPGHDRAEERRRPVNGARQDCADQDDEDGVERGFFRKRAPVADSDQAEPNDEDDERAQRDVQQGELSRFTVGTEKEEKEIVKHAFRP
jgi:hypothetical protein